MAFTPEDGSGVAGANAALTLQEFKDHHDDRGRDYAGAGYTDAQIQAAIVKATDYSEKRWGTQYRGEKGSSDQGLSWPRTSAMDDQGRLITERPSEWIKGVAEYAWLSLTLGTELAPVGTNVAGRVTEETVGPITTKYSDKTTPMVTTGTLLQNLPEYPEADLWFAELLDDSPRRLIRG